MAHKGKLNEVWCELNKKNSECQSTYEKTFKNVNQKKILIIKPKLFSFTHILRRGRKKTKGEVVDIQNIQKKKKKKKKKNKNKNNKNFLTKN